MRKVYIFGLAALTLSACKPNIDQQPPSAGEVDFARYLAVGNSATAGFADGTLYMSAQRSSYPAILAEQLKLVGGGKFVQPELPEGDRGYPEPKMLLRLIAGSCDTVLTTIHEERGKDSASSTINVADVDEPFNNMGIPNARVVDYITTGYGTVNPYAKRSFLNPTTATPLAEALRLKPTFFTMWLGNNDVLLNAIFGGNSSSPIPITSVTDFRSAYDSVLTALVRRTSRGLAFNIPDLGTMPFFTTIAPKGLKLTQDQATSLNLFYQGLRNPIRFDAGDNYFVIQDGSVTRKIADGEMLLLSIPRDSMKCAGWGTFKPIPDRYVLKAGELSQIREATNMFNQIIRELANSHSIPVVDVDAFLRTIQSGIKFNGVSYGATYVSGGFYSLDGIHLNPRGNALMANYIINAINTNYSASIPSIDVNKYRGVIFP